MEPATLRGPDVGVVVEPPTPGDETGSWMPRAPDVAVEIVSHRTRSADSTGRSSTTDEPTRSGEDVLDGFSVRLSEIFES